MGVLDLAPIRTLRRRALPPRDEEIEEKGARAVPLYFSGRVISLPWTTCLPRKEYLKGYTTDSEIVETWWPTVWKQMCKVASHFLWGVLNPFQGQPGPWGTSAYHPGWGCLVVCVHIFGSTHCVRSLVSSLAFIDLAPSFRPIDWSAWRIYLIFFTCPHTCHSSSSMDQKVLHHGFIW